MDHQDHDLGSIMRRLEESNKALVKSNRKVGSVWWSFLRGVMYGFGVFIGSALLVTAFLYILSKVEGWAFIGNYAHNILSILKGSSR